MKKILITGTNSYIGTSFKNWLGKYPDKYQVDELDMLNRRWKERCFTSYDVIFHVAGLAHTDIGKINVETRAKYYQINRDLTIEVACKAKKEGVKHFIFMSSIIVYGNGGRIGHPRLITRETPPTPTNFYGDSKLQAEQGILELNDIEFTVSVLRSPMIYGKNSKGNYMLLKKIACSSPIFPKIPNERSMLYIDNLCEFVRLLIDYKQSGIFFPQNKDYVQTSTMVDLISKAHGKKIWITTCFNWLFIFLEYIPGKMSQLISKAFGNFTYEHSDNVFEKNVSYQLYNLEESIELMEGKTKINA